MARYKLVGPDVVHEEFDGEIVVLNLQTGQYFGLNEAGAALWMAVETGHDPVEVSTKHGAAFATRLVALGLIVESDEVALPAQVQDFATAPLIEVYDDLSDLILADPIHDVDEERGWPKVPEDT
ncbi:PqqD family peptide modification chaperone [Yoonia sp. I 8.24]|uniref:PqqD family peptide modification chaperone n=1 Tax=Yoonia sp. I 8.24 TaxID=1537229 RepID=UPI001EDFC83B|nr:PqqD family peptide modification chaperone [Yoonia sp. I 8.24]MCG3267384.1 PqqD family peptide modification chaperone [Yoonia sp. I 8.24]